MKIPGDKNERWVPLSLHMVGSDVAMLAHTRLWSPRWLQFAWAQSDRRHLSQSLWPLLTSGTGSGLSETGLNADMGRAVTGDWSSLLRSGLWPDQNVACTNWASFLQSCTHFLKGNHRSKQLRCDTRSDACKAVQANKCYSYTDTWQISLTATGMRCTPGYKGINLSWQCFPCSCPPPILLLFANTAATLALLISVSWATHPTQSPPVGSEVFSREES